MNEIKYRLIAEVDDQVVFQSSYEDTVMLMEELYKAERAVEKEIGLENSLLEDEDLDEDILF